MDIPFCTSHDYFLLVWEAQTASCVGFFIPNIVGDKKNRKGERRQLTQVLGLKEESETDLERRQDIPKDWDRNKYFIPGNVYFLCPHITYIYF